jgi:dipeptidyl-peptidase-4
MNAFSFQFTVALLVLRLVLPGSLFPQERTKEFTVEDIFGTQKFSAKSIRGFQWIKEGKAYSYLETDTAKKQTDIWKYDVATGNKTKLVDASKLVLKEDEKPFRIQNYIWSPDEKNLLFTGTVTARSLKSGGNFFLYNLAAEKFRQLTEVDEQQVNVKFSPNGKTIGFVRENNIFILDIESGKEAQLTFDGAEHVLNGHFDWVYEEEFSIIDGWQWSPDGKYIAYWQLDENRVPEFPIVDFIPLHQRVQRMRYPKAGEPNSIVRIGVVSLGTPPASVNTQGRAGKQTKWMDIGEPVDSTQDTYIARINWTNKPSTLAIQKVNRRQNRLDLMLADVTTGKSKTILSETEKTWVDVRDDLRFLKKTDSFVWSSERDGFLHLYLYDLNGKLIRQLTQGKWSVDRLLGVDEDKGVVYFTASVTSPLERDVYAVNLSGKGFRRITRENGTNSANFAPDFSLFLHTFSDVNTPPKISLRKSDGSLIRVVEEGSIEALKEYNISPKTFFTFTTSDGVELNGWMIKPHEFDAAKKHPVLMYVYGGPGSQTVRNSWEGGNFLWYQLLAQKGYIVVSVDGRGTGARGKAFESITYKNLGEWETKDQIEAAKYLAKLPYVDGSRIGIWGWSYGGYMTLMSMLLGADSAYGGAGIFKAGISGAPVTHWKFYDTIYTERFMLTPKENAEGYERSAPLTHAGKLKGDLLIIHGTSDDNVHWQNTVSMVNELIKEGKQFQTFYYPSHLHGIGGKARVHLYEMMTKFVVEKL